MSSLLIFLRRQIKVFGIAATEQLVLNLEVYSHLSTSAFREDRTSFSFWESTTM